MKSPLSKSLLFLTSFLLVFQFCQPMLALMPVSNNTCEVNCCPSRQKKPVKNERSCPAVVRCDISNCCYTRPNQPALFDAAPVLRTAIPATLSLLSPMPSEIFQPPECV